MVGVKVSRANRLHSESASLRENFAQSQLLSAPASELILCRLNRSAFRWRLGNLTRTSLRVLLEEWHYSHLRCDLSACRFKLGYYFVDSYAVFNGLVAVRVFLRRNHKRLSRNVCRCTQLCSFDFLARFDRNTALCMFTLALHWYRAQSWTRIIKNRRKGTRAIVVKTIRQWEDHRRHSFIDQAFFRPVRVSSLLTRLVFWVSLISSSWSIRVQRTFYSYVRSYKFSVCLMQLLHLPQKFFAFFRTVYVLFHAEEFFEAEP